MKMNADSNIMQQAKRASSINLEQSKVAAILLNKEALTNLNRAQMREGLTSEGNPITPDYSRGYAWYKEKLPSYKAPPGTPDLFVTGAFQAGMSLALRNGVEFFSSDAKAGQLSGRYGRKIFGLMTENMLKARQIVSKSYIMFVSRNLLKR